MDLEAKFLDMSDDSEEQSLHAMRRRFWVAAILSPPVVILAMGPMIGLPVAHSLSPGMVGLLQLSLATPVVFWCGRPLLVRGVNSFRTMNLNIFSLIAVGTVSAFAFSVVVVLFPKVIPEAFYEHGSPPLYFQAAAVIIIFPTFGEWKPQDLLRSIAAIEAQSEHPLAQAVVRYARIESISIPDADHFESITGGSVTGNVQGNACWWEI